jgi:hypothetical protein
MIVRAIAFTNIAAGTSSSHLPPIYLSLSQDRRPPSSTTIFLLYPISPPFSFLTVPTTYPRLEHLLLLNLLMRLFSLKAVWEVLNPIYNSHSQLCTITGSPSGAPNTDPDSENDSPGWTPADLIRRSRNPSGEGSAKDDWESGWIMVPRPPQKRASARRPSPKQAHQPPSSLLTGNTNQRDLSPDARHFLDASPTKRTRPANPSQSQSVPIITKNHDINVALYNIIHELMRLPPMPTLYQTSPQDAEKDRGKWYGKICEEALKKVEMEGIKLDEMEMNIFLKVAMVALGEEATRVENVRGTPDKGQEKEWEKGIEYEWAKGRIPSSSRWGNWRENRS